MAIGAGTHDIHTSTLCCYEMLGWTCFSLCNVSYIMNANKHLSDDRMYMLGFRERELPVKHIRPIRAVSRE
nr:unnamed protein product [Callosobruchus analis]